MNLILYAIPGFFFLIALELIAEKVRGTQLLPGERRDH